MALIDVNPDFKALTREMKRIADALELHLLYEHNHRTTPTPKMDTDDTEVLYATDKETFKQELLDIADHRDPLRPIDGDEGT